MSRNFYECEYCEKNFDHKEKFIKHIKNQHMTLVYICEGCPAKFKIASDCEDHLIKTHNYKCCETCKICYRDEEIHECGEITEAYKCDLGNCRDKIYIRLNFFVRHLQVEHKIAKLEKIKEIIETSHKKVIKPAREKAKQTATFKEGYNQPSVNFFYQEDEFNELVNYVNSKMNSDDNQSDYHEAKENYLLQASKKIKFSYAADKPKSSESHSAQGSDIKQGQINLLQKSECKEEENQFENQHDNFLMLNEKQDITSATKKIKDFERLKGTTSTSKSVIIKKQELPKEFSDIYETPKIVPQKTQPVFNECELVLCNYKDNKKFIQTIRYEDILLQALVLTQSIKTKTDIFKIHRFGKPYKDFSAYNRLEFKDNFYVRLEGIPSKDDQEFEEFVEKQYRIKTYSAITHKITEHKRYSAYMLNKKIKLTCENCAASFKSFDEFIHHFRECMFEKIAECQSFHCPICHKEILNYFAMLQHLENQHFII